MKIIQSALVALSLLSASVFAFSQKQEAIPVNIRDIEGNPLKYDGKVVRVNGYVISNRSGIGLTGKNFSGLIRLRPPDEVGLPLPIQRDRMFKKFWKMVKSDIGPNTVSVELDAIIRVSKGKRPVDYLGKWPIFEAVPVRILRIERTGK